ncbi:isocyanide synthase family protein [Shewanella surugensis]|uniref:Isocyanide synthase family protein n=1 Tax=Shewanella surugensis TaxID=212020 RepID=A0ABT0LFL9_9GAMM|nr:isocyanide synthase family protein [Shewanella surugensis]MCL1126496.1 isocyanide synthase family protein [Shewanella surugensis]
MNKNNKVMENDILAIIFKWRKLLKSEHSELEPPFFSNLSLDEIDPHLIKIGNMVVLNQPIHMILPAYPGKSPNRNKTLSRLPDLAETHSIDVLNQLCSEIGEVYAPGAKISICSDGYVFADLVRIPDEDVFAYTEAIQAYYQNHYPERFDFFDLKDAFGVLSDFDAMREELMVRYGESLIGLTEQAKTDKATLSMYKGIAKFLFEDFSGLMEFATISNTQIQKQAKAVSLRVIQRSNAWSRLLEEYYPNALRLSIHPQFRVSEKIGIQMGNSDDAWRTPWHSVAIKQGNEIHLQKRSQVDENTHRLIFNQGKPSHYHHLTVMNERSVGGVA